MSRMDYYSNELEDDFIEIDDIILSEEYHFSEVKEKKGKEKDSSYDWTHSATVTSPVYYNSQWLPSQLNCANTRQCVLDAQQYNGYQNLANACQTQQFIANPTDFIQQQLNVRCNNVENGFRNLCDAISKIMED